MRALSILLCCSIASAAAIAVASLAGDPPKPPSNPTHAKQPSPFSHGTGVTTQMKSMDWLVGTWKVRMTYFMPGGKTFEKGTESIIELMLNGSFLQERITVPAGPALDNPMIGIRSFDRFRNTYRLVWCDSVITIADVFEGEATPDGFVVSNLTTSTAGMFNGTPSIMRITQKAGDDRDSFTLTWELTPDDGATWIKTADYTYSRKP